MSDEKAREVIAQVLFLNGRSELQWADVVEHVKDQWRSMADVAMKAHIDLLKEAGLKVLAREPTETMRDAPNNVRFIGHAYRHIWQLMWDAATPGAQP